MNEKPTAKPVQRHRTYVSNFANDMIVVCRPVFSGVVLFVNYLQLRLAMADRSCLKIPAGQRQECSKMYSGCANPQQVDLDFPSQKTETG